MGSGGGRRRAGPGVSGARGRPGVVKPGGIFPDPLCSPVPAGGVFSEPGPGRVGRANGLCAHRVQRRAFGRPLLAAPGPGAGRRQPGGRRRALAFPGLRSGLAAGHDGGVPGSGAGQPGGGRHLLVGECGPGGRRPGFHPGLADFLLCPGRYGPGADSVLRPVGGRNLGPGPDVLRGEAGLRHLRRGLSRGPGYLSGAPGLAGADSFTGPGGRPGRPGIPAAAGLKRPGPPGLPAASA